jgi:hypothetical protein
LCQKIGKTAFLRDEFIFLEKGHLGYQKIKNFMLILKKQTCLSDKMPPRKVKKLFSNFAKSHLFSFFISTLFGGMLSLRQVCLHF